MVSKSKRTIMVTSELYDRITALAEATAKKQGLTTISRPQLIEMMIKQFESS